MYKYTLCFIKRGNNILMLNRYFKPIMGRWNGIGGKLEVGETPEQCVLRETFEETGISLGHTKFVGTVTWITDKGSSGMYVFISEVATDFHYVTPITVEEGILDWKELEWVLSPDNLGIANNIQEFLPSMLSGELLDHKYTFNDKEEILEYSKRPITI